MADGKLDTAVLELVMRYSSEARVRKGRALAWQGDNADAAWWKQNGVVSLFMICRD